MALLLILELFGAKTTNHSTNPLYKELSMVDVNTLEELHRYLCKSVRKAENCLQKHRAGIWSNAPHYISKSEVTVKKWENWRDIVAEILKNEQNP